MSVNTVAKYLYCRVDLRHQQLSQVSGSCEMLDQLKNISEQGQIRADNQLDKIISQHWPTTDIMYWQMCCRHEKFCLN